MQCSILQRATARIRYACCLSTKALRIELMMNGQIFALGLLIGMGCAPANAQSARTSTIVTVSGVQLALPAVAGFRAPEGDERLVLNTVRVGVPPQHRMLALLLSEDDFKRFAEGELPRLDRYYVVQIPKRAEGMVVTISDFQSVRRSMKDDHSLLMRAHSAGDRDAIKAIDRGGRTLVDTRLPLRTAEPLALGIVEDSESAVGVHYLTRERPGDEFAPDGRRMLTISIATVLRNRLIFLDGACDTRTFDDIVRCRRNMKEWIALLHAANP